MGGGHVRVTELIRFQIKSECDVQIVPSRLRLVSRGPWVYYLRSRTVLKGSRDVVILPLYRLVSDRECRNGGFNVAKVSCKTTDLVQYTSVEESFPSQLFPSQPLLTPFRGF